ncbi:lac operon transcriptional repressor [Klebsiella michiganensis]|uniref:Lac operon transcriptional repressor n=1 Tax=Klebsiella michiganensis TaxID=1134687 RepID=A0A7H4MYG4_9ENTR|nr:lac operon transcriptional repressor [Klebsiella michiganensis]
MRCRCRSDYPSLQARLNEFRAQHIRGAIISLPLESSLAERLVVENPISPACFLMFRRRPTCAACVSIIATAAARACGISGTPAPGVRPAGRPESSVSARMRLSSWREALHRLGVSNAVTVFGDWSAASGWNKTFELLHHHPRISAIVVANDQMGARGTERAGAVESHRQPGDLGHRL